MKRMSWFLAAVAAAFGAFEAHAQVAPRRAGRAPVAKRAAPPVVDLRNAERYPVLSVESNGYLRLGTIADQRRVQMIGVEMSGKEATRFLEQLLRGKSVDIVSDPAVKPAEKDDPAPVYVFRASDRLFVNLELVARGLARTAPTQAFAQRELFLEREQAAIAKGVGLWAPDVQGADAPKVHAAAPAARRRPRRLNFGAAANRADAQRNFGRALDQLVQRVNPRPLQAQPFPRGGPFAGFFMAFPPNGIFLGGPVAGAPAQMPMPMPVPFAVPGVPLPPLPPVPNVP